MDDLGVPPQMHVEYVPFNKPYPYDLGTPICILNMCHKPIINPQPGLRSSEPGAEGELRRLRRGAGLAHMAF